MGRLITEGDCFGLGLKTGFTCSAIDKWFDRPPEGVDVQGGWVRAQGQRGAQDQARSDQTLAT